MPVRAVFRAFARYVARYGGDKNVRTLTCVEQFRVMAFAQLTYHESLRDIEVCLTAQDAKLYHMGFREPIRRSNMNFHRVYSAQTDRSAGIITLQTERDQFETQLEPCCRPSCDCCCSR